MRAMEERQAYWELYHIWYSVEDWLIWEEAQGDDTDRRNVPSSRKTWRSDSTYNNPIGGGSRGSKG